MPPIDRHIRKFLIRATGLSPYATDQDVENHLAALSPAVRQACMNHAEAERRETETDPADPTMIRFQNGCCR